MNAEPRLSRIREALAARGLDMFAVEGPSNVAYLTGFDRVFDDERSSVCVISGHDARVYVDSRYDEAARAAAAGTPWSVEGPCSDIWESVLETLRPQSTGALGLEASMPYHRYTAIAAKYQGEVTPVEGLVERVREVKDEAEIELIAKAASIGDAAFAHILGFIAPGLTEMEIALELEIHMRRNGSEGLAFPSIVAGGPNSSRPHAQVSSRALQSGDLLTMDFGARVGGYCSDMTRTVAVGRASDHQREIYRVVLAANEAGIAAVRAGRTGSEIDSAARDVIAAAGFGDRFGHGLGHGVGLDVHEGPRVGPRGMDALPQGSVVTIEPGVYVPGIGGVRIEDLVMVDGSGARVLTHAPKELMEV